MQLKYLRTLLDAQVSDLIYILSVSGIFRIFELLFRII